MRNSVSFLPKFKKWGNLMWDQIFSVHFFCQQHGKNSAVAKKHTAFRKSTKKLYFSHIADKKIVPKKVGPTSVPLFFTF